MDVIGYERTIRANNLIRGMPDFFTCSGIDIGDVSCLYVIVFVALGIVVILSFNLFIEVINGIEIPQSVRIVFEFFIKEFFRFLQDVDRLDSQLFRLFRMRIHEADKRNVRNVSVGTENLSGELRRGTADP